ncbi:MAG: hypothetical protein SGI88_12230 [Candidatus Hydrogenedentes bacterium]|nr:hypothetical protein [Candidatus Hydrogenedentota bacterium]
MLFFGKKDKGAGQPIHPLVGRRAFCRICDSDQMFTKCWRRAAMVRQCTGCGAAFENSGQLYQSFQPQCPHCAEFLEQPGFDYGMCDTCGSKFELPDGAKPGLLPNKEQRQRMGIFGQIRNK